ncbi:MAG: glycosyltransferase family 39 protein [bacterium JZ-2024 1]
MKSKYYWLVAGGGFFLLSLSLLPVYSLWMRETQVASLILQTGTDFFSRLIQKGELPLYPLLARIFSSFFDSSETSLRLLSLLFAFFSFLPFYALFRYTEEEETALWGVTLLALSPCFLFYGRMATPYSLLLLLYLTNLFFWVRWQNGEKKYEPSYLLTGLFLVWTDVHSLFLLLLHPVYLLYNKKEEGRWNLLFWLWQASSVLTWLSFSLQPAWEIRLHLYPGVSPLFRDVLSRALFVFQDFLFGSFFPGIFWAVVHFILFVVAGIPGFFFPGKFSRLWQWHIVWLLLFCLYGNSSSPGEIAFLPGRLFFFSFLVPLLFARGIQVMNTAFPPTGFVILGGRFLALLPVWTALFTQHNALVPAYATPWKEIARAIQKISQSHGESLIVVDEPTFLYYLSSVPSVVLFQQEAQLEEVEERILDEIPRYVIICWDSGKPGGYTELLNWMEEAYTGVVEVEAYRESDSVRQWKKITRTGDGFTLRKIRVYRLFLFSGQAGR